VAGDGELLEPARELLVGQGPKRVPSSSTTSDSESSGRRRRPTDARWRYFTRSNSNWKYSKTAVITRSDHHRTLVRLVADEDWRIRKLVHLVAKLDGDSEELADDVHRQLGRKTLR